MIEYKKRVRIFADRHGLVTEYLRNGGLRIRKRESSIEFISHSKNVMTCEVVDPLDSIRFGAKKQFVFDIIDKFANSRAFSLYSPQQTPLSIQEYIEEEKADKIIEELREKIVAGSVGNGQLGGNRFNIEYYNGILILFDDLIRVPTNVIDATNCL